MQHFVKEEITAHSDSSRGDVGHVDDALAHRPLKDCCAYVQLELEVPLRCKLLASVTTHTSAR